MAAAAYNATALHLKGPRARLNFPKLADSLPKPVGSNARDIQLAAQEVAIRQNEIIQGDIRKALSKHLIGLCKAKLINLQAILGPLLQPFIPSVPIQEVADALVSSFGHLFCSPPFNSLNPLLQSRDLSKMISLLLAQLFSTMGGLLCLLYGFPLQLSLIGCHLPCHLKARKHF
ncbi:hypothetical protein RJ640_012004 [Escallonia rubra]|uniref:AP2/ERF domain-containing protein n=1 Tax=Escallonia rubra TaxID=112253 RepID=A0AA88UIW3_9ASTE|nr:hypothetical protein RJ640_012004 [Escallonia rubra]